MTPSSYPGLQPLPQFTRTPSEQRLSLFCGTLLLLPLVTLTAAGCSHGQASPAAPPPPTVSVLEIKPQTVSLASEWVATLDGFVNAQVRPQVTGYLVRTTYREGAFVHKGDV